MGVRRVPHPCLGLPLPLWTTISTLLHCGIQQLVKWQLIDQSTSARSMTLQTLHHHWLNCQGHNWHIHQWEWPNLCINRTKITSQLGCVHVVNHMQSVIDRFSKMNQHVNMISSKRFSLICHWSFLFQGLFFRPIGKWMKTGWRMWWLVLEILSCQKTGCWVSKLEDILFFLLNTPLSWVCPCTCTVFFLFSLDLVECNCICLHSIALLKAQPMAGIQWTVVSRHNMVAFWSCLPTDTAWVHCPIWFNSVCVLLIFCLQANTCATLGT